MKRYRQRSAEADAKPKLINDEGADWVDRPLSIQTVAEAINRAYQLYNGTGDVEGVLVFLSVALCRVKLSAETIAWATELIARRAAGDPDWADEG
jgi:hypothetical protein